MSGIRASGKLGGPGHCGMTPDLTHVLTMLDPCVVLQLLPYQIFHLGLVDPQILQVFAGPATCTYHTLGHLPNRQVPCGCGSVGLFIVYLPQQVEMITFFALLVMHLEKIS